MTIAGFWGDTSSVDTAEPADLSGGTVHLAIDVLCFMFFRAGTNVIPTKGPDPVCSTYRRPDGIARPRYRTALAVGSGC